MIFVYDCNAREKMPGKMDNFLSAPSSQSERKLQGIFLSKLWALVGEQED